MIEIARTIAVRLALCAAATFAVWKLGFDTGILFMASLFGVALAKPLLDLAGELRHQWRRAHWHAEEGRHHAFRGNPLQVLTDTDRQRWVRLADVRRIVGVTASDGALQLTYPNGFRRVGKAAEPHLSDEALLAHLVNESSPVAVKFRPWVEREIVFPARRERDRLGIRLEALDFRASD